MSDVVVTLPLSFGIERWIEEGDPAGEPYSGRLWDFSVGGGEPKVSAGERVYVVYGFRLIGYAPLVALEREDGCWLLTRGGGAVAVTLSERIVGFRGWRYRWWDRALEMPCPDWRTPYTDARLAKKLGGGR